MRQSHQVSLLCSGKAGETTVTKTDIFVGFHVERIYAADFATAQPHFVQLRRLWNKFITQLCRLWLGFAQFSICTYLPCDTEIKNLRVIRDGVPTDVFTQPTQTAYFNADHRDNTFWPIPLQLELKTGDCIETTIYFPKAGTWNGTLFGVGQVTRGVAV